MTEEEKEGGGRRDDGGREGGRRERVKGEKVGADLLNVLPVPQIQC